MPDCGMAAVDHRCRTRVETDLISKISRPFSNVLQYQSIDIPSSGAEQSNNISCSVVPLTRDDPTPIDQLAVDERRFFARGFSGESDQLPKYSHLAPPVEESTSLVLYLVSVKRSLKIEFGSAGAQSIQPGRRISLHSRSARTRLFARWSSFSGSVEIQYNSPSSRHTIMTANTNSPHQITMCFSISPEKLSHFWQLAWLLHRRKSI